MLLNKKRDMRKHIPQILKTNNIMQLDLFELQIHHQ
jgi:hypothetical protein